MSIVQVPGDSQMSILGNLDEKTKGALESLFRGFLLSEKNLTNDVEKVKAIFGQLKATSQEHFTSLSEENQKLREALKRAESQEAEIKTQYQEEVKRLKEQVDISERATITMSEDLAGSLQRDNQRITTTIAEKTAAIQMVSEAADERVAAINGWKQTLESENDSKTAICQAADDRLAVKQGWLQDLESDKSSKTAAVQGAETLVQILRSDYNTKQEALVAGQNRITVLEHEKAAKTAVAQVAEAKLETLVNKLSKHDLTRHLL